MEYLSIKKFLFVFTIKLIVAENLNNLNYEIKSLFGQPDYRSVNLTWEVETKDENFPNSENHEEENFIVHYCELQSWGEMHRCKSKILQGSVKNNNNKSTKVYNTIIKNLRLATKYFFNVKVAKHGESEKSARSQIYNDDDNKDGQQIIIPTKGFSAVATKCLPNESEIQIDTGPYFGGRIISENGNCIINGDPKDDRETYNIRIDHEKCGSHVSHDDFTVETYITVQENSGLLTHSSRRFLVICNFQPDTLTVRARLALPSKGSSKALDDDEWPQRDRGARERQFKMVDKSFLVLKESNEQSIENAIGNIESLTENISLETTEKVTNSSTITGNKSEPFKNVRYSRHSSLKDEETNEVFLQIDSLIGITIGVALTVLL
ncbi:CLUMA_CG014424, isoform A, partial [Clunio marinus]